MKTSLKKLAEIIENNRKYYKSDPFWEQVATYYIEQSKELRERQKGWCETLKWISIREILGE